MREAEKVIFEDALTSITILENILKEKGLIIENQFIIIEEQKACLNSIYKTDLPIIDNLCELQGFHKFSLMRKEIELLLK